MRHGAREKVERGLGDVVARIGLDAGGELFALLRSGVRADEHAVAAAFANGFDHELVEIGEDVLALLVLGQQESLDVVDDRIFARGSSG